MTRSINQAAARQIDNAGGNDLATLLVAYNRARRALVPHPKRRIMVGVGSVYKQLE